MSDPARDGFGRERRAGRGRLSRAAFLALIALLYAFLIAPILIVVIASLNAGRFLVFPPDGLSFQWYVNFANSGPFVRSFFFSLRLAALTTAVATVIGTAAALYVVRHASRNDLLRMLLVAPLQLPGIMTALALLIFYYAIGLGGTSYLGLLLGHVLVCTPYVFLTVSAVLYNFDHSLEEAARSLGAGRLTTFGRITLPIIKGASSRAPSSRSSPPSISSRSRSCSAVSARPRCRSRSSTTCAFRSTRPWLPSVPSASSSRSAWSS